MNWHLDVVAAKCQSSVPEPKLSGGTRGRSQNRKVYQANVMSEFRQTPLSSLVDLSWRTAFRLGFPLARLWWRMTGQRHEGVVVAVYVGAALLLVRTSYRRGWHLPGGGVRRGEMPETAARRELAEEIGLRASVLLAAGSTCGTWDGRRDRVHFFELRLAKPPELKLDNREIVAARLISPVELQSMVLTGALAAYLGRVRRPLGCEAARN
jgi:8-oxo-dGTP diphosphatase